MKKLITSFTNLNILIVMAIRRLQSEYIQIKKDPNYFYNMIPSESDFKKWNFILIGPPDTFFEGGIFEGYLKFPTEYPSRPPELIFTTELFHPNIYKDGKVCISILHEGVDQYGYESSVERWLPSHGINSIMMSIVSMLGEPNFESPANVDASVMWKDDVNEYKKIIYKMIAKQ